MPQFECTEEEISFIKRKRTLVAAKCDRILLGLKPLVILEKIDARPEYLERRPPLAVPQSPQSNQV